ncbi:MAG TPA: hypothetical protein VFZ78_07685 [Flavisolibacter sp.]
MGPQLTGFTGGSGFLYWLITLVLLAAGFRYGGPIVRLALDRLYELLVLKNSAL